MGLALEQARARGGGGRNSEIRSLHLAHLLRSTTPDLPIEAARSGFRKARRRISVSVPPMRAAARVLGAIVLATLAGCGGGGGGGGKKGGEGSSVQAGLTASALSACLNDLNWLTIPSDTSIEGSSEQGTVLTIDIYDTPTAAKAAGRGRNQDVIGRVVVSYQKSANSTAVYGQPGTKNAEATKTIEQCIGDVTE